MCWWKRGDKSVGQPDAGTVTRPLPMRAGAPGARNFEFGAEASGNAPAVPGLPYPGVNNRLTVMHQPSGVERRPGWRNVNPGQWGARAAIHFGQLVMNPQTSRLQIQQWGPRTLCFTNVANAKDMGQEMISRPALEGPRYRFTAVNDAAVIAQARQRAQARASGGRGGVKL